MGRHLFSASHRSTPLSHRSTPTPFWPSNTHSTKPRVSAPSASRNPLRIPESGCCNMHKLKRATISGVRISVLRRRGALYSVLVNPISYEALFRANTHSAASPAQSAWGTQLTALKRAGSLASTEAKAVAGCAAVAVAPPAPFGATRPVGGGSGAGSAIECATSIFGSLLGNPGPPVEPSLSQAKVYSSRRQESHMQKRRATGAGAGARGCHHPPVSLRVRREMSHLLVVLYRQGIFFAHFPFEVCWLLSFVSPEVPVQGKLVRARGFRSRAFNSALARLAGCRARGGLPTRAPGPDDSR